MSDKELRNLIEKVEALNLEKVESSELELLKDKLEDMYYELGRRYDTIFSCYDDFRYHNSLWLRDPDKVFEIEADYKEKMRRTREKQKRVFSLYKRVYEELKHRGLE